MNPKTKKTWKVVFAAFLSVIFLHTLVGWVDCSTNKNRYVPVKVARERTCYTTTGNLVVNEEELFVTDTVTGKVKKIATQDFAYFKDFK